jgi:hypothetical protein
VICRFPCERYFDNVIRKDDQIVNSSTGVCMTKPDRKAITAKFAEVARKTGGVFVFATRDANLPRGENVSAEIAEYPFAEHTCKECTTVFAAVKAEGLHTQCTACGSDKVVAGKEVKPNIPSDSELAYLTCGGCGTHNVFASSLGKEVASALHCTACGAGLGYQSANADDMVDDTLDLDDMEVLDLDDDAVDEPEVVSTEDTDEEEKADALGVDVTDDSGTKATDKAVPGDEAGPSTGKPPEPTAVDTPTSQGNEEAPSEPGSNENGDPAQVPAATLSMLDTVDAKDPLTFAYLGGKVAILSGLKIVATLSEADAGDNASVMQTAAFRDAVGHTIGKSGLKEAAKHYGFKSVEVQVPVQAMIDKAVEAKTAEKAAKVTAALDDAAAQFQHAADIAAAGYAANFGRNKHDPVKAALIQELSSIGIPNAAKVVDRVFESHGVAQLREVIARARELSNMPVEALNGLAQAINLAKYQPAVTKVTASEDEDEDDQEDEDKEDDEDETESMVTTLATAEVEPQSETASFGSQPKSKELARILQGQPLSF